MSPSNRSLPKTLIVHPVDVTAPAQFVRFAPSAGNRSGPTTAAADRLTGVLSHHPYSLHSGPVAAHPLSMQKGGASDHIVELWFEGSKDVRVRYPHPAANVTSYRTVRRTSEGVPGGIAPLVIPPSRILPSQGRTDGIMPPVHPSTRENLNLRAVRGASAMRSMAACAMRPEGPKLDVPPTVGDVVSAHNRGMISITMLTAAALFLGASFYPSPLVLPVLSGFFMISAVVSMVIALAKRQIPTAPLFTFWDKAVFLLFLGMAAGHFTDMQAAQSYVEALQAAAAQQSGGG